ncbi:MAG: hypothetical protein GX051_08980 [Clostridiales bacterium]|nr:hypothetical protein [Clostridiales bacterium]
MVYVTGDTHGDIDRLSKSALKMLQPGDTLIICGDFGFIWSGEKKEKKLIEKLAKRKYTICFIDGTHENFELLNAYPVSEWNGGKVHKICDNIFHLMRGQIFEIEGLKFFTMGGGESPDIDVRFDISNWSRDEIPTQSELLEGADNIENSSNKVDIILTHEPPAKIKGFLRLSENDSVSVTALNSYFEDLSQSCEFSRWFFGSMHIDKYISTAYIGVFKNIIDASTGKKV